jgi:hypothetical protein
VPGDHVRARLGARRGGGARAASSSGWLRGRNAPIRRAGISECAAAAHCST